MNAPSADTQELRLPPTPGSAGRVRLPVLVAVLAVVLGTVTAVTLQDNSTEYKVKAAFLYNFARYTEWPAGSFADDEAPIVFAVVGEDPFGEILKAVVHDKALNGRPLELAHFKTLDDVLKARACHVLFVSESLSKQMAEVHKQLLRRPIFTVSEVKDFATLGGTARFYIKNNKVAFTINPSSAKRQTLTISSQLLKLASIVEDAEGVGR